MSYLNLEIGNQPPCQDEPGSPGVYFVDFHYRGRSGLMHDSISAGDQNPLDIPIGEQAAVYLAEADSRNGDHVPKRKFPLSRLVGMSVLRACVHEYETPAKRIDHLLVAEKLASFAFVKDVRAIYPVERAIVRTSMYGVARVHVGIGGEAKSFYAQHLEATPDEEAKYAVTHAIPSISSRGVDSDTWIALRQTNRSKRKPLFVERLVGGEELYDTLGTNF